MTKFVECKCGDRAYPSNWSVDGVGRLWYCFNCLTYLNENGEQQPYKVQQGKYQYTFEKESKAQDICEVGGFLYSAQHEMM